MADGHDRFDSNEGGGDFLGGAAETAAAIPQMSITESGTRAAPVFSVFMLLPPP